MASTIKDSDATCARNKTALAQATRLEKKKKQTKSNAPYHHEFVVEVGNLRVGYKIDHDVVARTCQRLSLLSNVEL